MPFKGRCALKVWANYLSSQANSAKPVDNGIVTATNPPAVQKNMAIEAFAVSESFYRQTGQLDRSYAPLHPATDPGCPTSRSFFARCGIPQL
jgi:hypothetical protein